MGPPSGSSSHQSELVNQTSQPHCSTLPVATVKPAPSAVHTPSNCASRHSHEPFGAQSPGRGSHEYVVAASTWQYVVSVLHCSASPQLIHGAGNTSCHVQLPPEQIKRLQNWHSL